MTGPTLKPVPCVKLDDPTSYIFMMISFLLILVYCALLIIGGIIFGVIFRKYLPWIVKNDSKHPKASASKSDTKKDKKKSKSKP